MKSENVIWLNGMPRSGTSWLSQIFDSHPNVSFKLSPLFSYEFKNRVNERSTLKEWMQFFEEVSASDDEFVNQSYRRESGEYPIFSKDDLQKLVIKDTRYHNLTAVLLSLFADIKIIHIVRHPCGAINSWLKAPKEFSQDLNPLTEWRTARSRKTGKEEFWGFNDWMFLTKKYLEWQKVYPKNVKVVYYEDIVEDALTETVKMFNFVGLNMSKQTESFINESQNLHDESEYAVFKDKAVVDKWKAELHPQIIDDISQELRINNLLHLFENY